MDSVGVGRRRLGSLGSTRLFVSPERAGSLPFRLLESLIEPAAALLTLAGLAAWYGHSEPVPDTVLAVLVFALSFPGKSLAQRGRREIVRDVLLGWAGLAAALLFFGVATGTIAFFPRPLVAHWLWLAPLAQVAGYLAFRAAAGRLSRAPGRLRRAIIAGCNDHGRQLAEEIAAHPLLGLRFAGYFDDRSTPGGDAAVLGTLAELPDYIKRNDVRLIFLALPMASQPRILDLLDGLRDTTASIYFVPDVFVTDLIQARMATIGRMPVVAVCDSPFSGVNGVVKRGSDLVLAVLILLLIAPLLLAVAVLVRLDSPGPAIFRQRRYGLDGKEITIYKFRSMHVCEDGDTVPQARRDDPRFTPLGRFLRRTSIDELPQFFNVLLGQMSIVGPRPHAVAHNETYRKLIKGYMIRHKVRPGITGWAQINGCRGETETLDKMQARIDYDLEYLRNWSLRLDLYIVARTLLVVFRDAGAY